MLKIIDSHCHIYPDSIARKAVKAVDRFYDGLSEDQHDGTVATLISSGEACGISHFIVHSVATSPHQVHSINHFIADSVAASGGRFTGMGTLHLDSEDMEGDMQEILALGLKGVKLHPDIQRFNLDDDRAMRIYEFFEEKGLPVCAHTGDYRYDFSNPPRVAHVLRTFPKLKFIGPHFAGWSVWDKALAMLPDFPNLMVDTSSTLHYKEPEEVKEMILAYGPERVMFGTDYPLWKQQPELTYLKTLNLEPEAFEGILWKNAARLFEIPVTDP